MAVLYNKGWDKIFRGGGIGGKKIRGGVKKILRKNEGMSRKKKEKVIIKSFGK